MMGEHTNGTRDAPRARARRAPRVCRLAAVLAVSTIAMPGIADAAGPSGLTGPTGLAGLPGAPGPTGPQGLDAPDPVQAIQIDWQNGHSAGNDETAFVAPGIGIAQVVCSPTTQWINFVPYDLGADTEMWGAMFYGDTTVVMAAARRASDWGDEFYLPLDESSHRSSSEQGSMTGIISRRGSLGELGGPGPPPTTFHISWYWSFADGYGPRCYVNGSAVWGG